MKLIPLFESTADLLDGMGYPNAKFLNSGSEGDVYDIGGDVVLKIGKKDDFDYCFYRTDKEIQTGKYDHYVKIYRTGVYKGHQWSIKEKVKPMTKEDTKDIVDYFEKENISIDTGPLHTLWFYYLDNDKKLPKELERWQSILDSILKMHRKTRFDVDIGESNMGINKKGEIVIFDV